jgi:hypothetical protein
MERELPTPARAPTEAVFLSHASEDAPRITGDSRPVPRPRAIDEVFEVLAEGRRGRGGSEA